MISNKYSNYTLFGIKSETERYIWAAWLIFVFICSTVGDIVILVASIKYNAFKLHNLMVAFIQHIAVCDLLLSARILCRIAALIIDTRKEFCYSFYFEYYIIFVNIFLICGMTSSKLFLMTNSLNTRPLPKKQAHKICFSIWLVTLIHPSIHFLVDVTDVYWDYRTYSCFYAYSSENGPFFKAVNFVLFGGVPNLTVIVISIYLIKLLLEARKVSHQTRGRVRWQGIATVLTVAIVYTISILPICVTHLIEMYVKKEHEMLHTYFLRVTLTLFYLNLVSNFIIYYFTVKSFRSFLQTKIRQIRLKISRLTTSIGMILRKPFSIFVVCLRSDCIIEEIIIWGCSLAKKLIRHGSANEKEQRMDF